MIRGRLLVDGFSLSEFAEKKGFSLHLLNSVIRRYCGTTAVPRGEQTKAVLAALEQYAGEEPPANH